MSEGMLAAEYLHMEKKKEKKEKEKKQQQNNKMKKSPALLDHDSLSEKAIPYLKISCSIFSDIVTASLFVLRFYGPVDPMGSCRTRSVYLTTRLLGKLSSKRLTSTVHILSPETDNCPS